MAAWIANVLLFLALASGVWYAWETRKMRLQAIRPKVVILMQLHEAEVMEDSLPVDLIAANVGDGIALNVVVEHAQDQQLKIRFAPEHIPVLRSGEQIELTMHPAEGNYQPDMTTVLEDSSVSLKVTVRYIDAENHQFRTSTMVGAGAKPPFIQDETT